MNGTSQSNFTHFFIFIIFTISLFSFFCAIFSLSILQKHIFSFGKKKIFSHEIKSGQTMLSYLASYCWVRFSIESLKKITNSFKFAANEPCRLAVIILSELV